MTLHFASTTGRFVVDIDGCLRLTPLASLGRADIVALHGALPDDAMLVWERDGELVPLGAGDRIRLDEERVAFFRSDRRPRLFRVAPRGARFSDALPAAIAA